MTQQRTVLLVQTQAEAGGAQEIARILAERLEARGFTPKLVFFFRRTAAYDHDPRAVYCAETRPATPLALLRMLTNLYRIMRQSRPAAVLCFQHYGNLIAAPIARLARLGPVIANANSPMFQLSAAVVRAETLLGELGVFSKIVVPSRDAERDYLARSETFRSRIVRIDHGFEPKSATRSKTAARAAFNLPSDAPLLCCVARLHADKNQIAILRILPENPAWHLALFGDGADRDHLAAEADRLGVASRVHFVGEVPPAEIGNAYAAADVFVFPSRCETFGLACVEAAQSGLPVIVNDIPVLRETLATEQGPCAAFVDVEDAKAFADAVRRMLEDADWREQITGAASTLKARYSLDAMADGYVRIIEGDNPVRNSRERPFAPKKITS